MATYELIASNVVDASNPSTITFSPIPQTYNDLMIFISTRTPEAALYSDCLISFNSDTSTSYKWKVGYQISSAANSTNANNNSTARIAFASNGTSTNTAAFSNAQIYIPGYTLSKVKTALTQCVVDNNGTTCIVDFGVNNWPSTAAINSISFTHYSGTTFSQYSSIHLYGIKNA